MDIPPSPNATSPPPVSVTFSHELRELTEQFGERPVCLAEILAATHGRGFHLLLVLIALPFLTPIPLPGLSIPFGLVVSIIGGRMALGQKPWLPQRLLQRELPPRFLSRLLRTATWIVKALERLLRPRLPFVNDYFIFRRLAGVLIFLSGLYLLLPLPLPLPFSNSLPAWTVLLLASGALARDGLFFLFGCAAFAVTTTFFVLLAFGGTHALERLRQVIAGG